MMHMKKLAMLFLVWTPAGMCQPLTDDTPLPPDFDAGLSGPMMFDYVIGGVFLGILLLLS